MGAERHSFQWEEFKVCVECGERIPHFMFHLHEEWVHPSFWRRVVGFVKRRARR